MPRSLSQLVFAWALMLPGWALAEAGGSASAGLNFRVVIPRSIQFSVGTDQDLAAPSVVIQATGNVRALFLNATATAPPGEPKADLPGDNGRSFTFSSESRRGRAARLSVRHPMADGAPLPTMIYTLASP